MDSQKILSSEGFVLSDSTAQLGQGTGGPASPDTKAQIIIDDDDTSMISLTDTKNKSQQKINQQYSKSMDRNQKHRNFQIDENSQFSVSEANYQFLNEIPKSDQSQSQSEFGRRSSILSEEDNKYRLYIQNQQQLPKIDEEDELQQFKRNVSFDPRSFNSPQAAQKDTIETQNDILAEQVIISPRDDNHYVLINKISQLFSNNPYKFPQNNHFEQLSYMYQRYIEIKSELYLQTQEAIENIENLKNMQEQLSHSKLKDATNLDKLIIDNENKVNQIQNLKQQIEYLNKELNVMSKTFTSEVSIIRKERDNYLMENKQLMQKMMLNSNSSSQEINVNKVQVDITLLNSLNEEISQQKKLIQQNHFNIEQKNQVIDKFTKDFSTLENQLDTYKNDNVSLREDLRSKTNQLRVLSKQMTEFGFEENGKIEFPIFITQKDKSQYVSMSETDTDSGILSELSYKSQPKKIDFQTMIQSQINSLVVTDKLLKKQKFQKSDTLSNIQKSQELSGKLEQKIETLTQENTSLKSQLDDLNTQSIKLKQDFTTLLDKFQGLLNNQEQKKASRHQQEIEQSQILDQLNETILEMEQLIKDQQNELKQKEQEMYGNKLEVIRLNSEVEYLQNKQDQLIKQNKDDKINQIQIKTLKDEIKYLKEFSQKEVEKVKRQSRNNSEKSRYMLRPEEQTLDVMSGSYRSSVLSSSMPRIQNLRLASQDSYEFKRMKNQTLQFEPKYEQKYDIKSDYEDEIKDLKNERSQLLRDLEKSNQSLKEMRNRVDLYEQKIKQFEVVKQKVINITELFEKKQISECRYSVEILCDFVLNKVKSLMAKQENSQQLLTLQQKSIKLEQQNTYLKESWSILNNNVIPFLQNLLGLKKQMDMSSHQINEILQMVEKQFKKSQYSLSSNSMQELLNLKKEKARMRQKIEEFSQILDQIQKENSQLRKEIRARNNSSIMKQQDSMANISGPTNATANEFMLEGLGMLKRY